MNARVFDPKEFTAALPRRPGVYRMFGAEHEILYVGKAKSLKDRVSTYFAASNVNPKVQALVQQITDIEVTVTNSETEALLLEYNLIKEHKPRYNIVLRDDKSFPYVYLPSGHEFPRLVFYRGPRNDAFLKNFAKDLGPLRTELLKSNNPGDFEFARHGVGTNFEAFIVLAKGVYLICNNTQSSMNEIARDSRWLNAQVPFVEFAEKVRSSPLEVPV